MTELKISKIATASSIAALATMPVVLMSANASASSCPTGSTLVAPGVCQIQVTQSETLNLPSGITKLSAVLVGGGGGSVNSGVQYGGGGGAVTYIDRVATTAPLVITIGAGGDSSLTPNSTGGVTSIAGYTAENALGGAAIGNATGGSSGNGTASTFLSGSGAGGASTSDSQPGPGILPSSIAGVDTTLFPVIAGEVALGAGGSPSATTAAAANTGDGGNLGDGTSATQSGGSGEVLLRFAVPVELAHTGANAGLIAGIAGALVTAGGSFMLLAQRRRTDSIN